MELLRDWNRLEPGQPGQPGQNLGNAQFSSTLTDDRLTAGLSTWSELLDEVIARHIYRVDLVDIRPFRETYYLGESTNSITICYY